jgi:hypothetical protein
MLAMGLMACAASAAQTNWRSQLDSAHPVDRETALLLMGDSGLADTADVEAVAERLRDPVPAVRWNAIAALRKAGPAATPVLLARLSDGRMSQHVASYFTGCSRAPFVPSEAELAAATLAALPEVDGDAMWRRFAADDSASSAPRLLRAALEAARIPPPPALLKNAHKLREDVRNLAFRQADAKDGQAIEAIAAALLAAPPDRPEAFERGVAMVVARAGQAGRSTAALGLASSPYPEAWLTAFVRAGNEHDAELTAQAFEAAAMSGRPPALRTISHALAALPRTGAHAPAWLVRVSPAAMHAFITQPLASGTEIDALAEAARHLVPHANWRPAVIDMLARMLTASERDAMTSVSGLDDLAVDLTASMNLRDRQHAWHVLRSQIGAPGARNASFATVLQRLPPPPRADRPALAALLVEAVMQGRLSPAALGGYEPPRSTRPTAASADAMAWRLALRNSVPPVAPGRESRRARLLAELGADRALVHRAWRAVDASPTATAADSADALSELAEHPSTRAFARQRLMERLVKSPDREAATIFADALWGRMIRGWPMAFDQNERLRREALLDDAWEKISRLPRGSHSRAAALQVLFSGTEFDMRAPNWAARASGALGTSDTTADAALLAYLAHAAPDVSAQALRCSEDWLYTMRTSRNARLEAAAATQLAAALRAPLASGGAAAELALRIWRGFGLPADADIEARTRQAEAARAAACPAVGSTASLDDLATTLQLPIGDATRASRFAEALDSRSAAVACGAAEELSVMGRDAVPGAASMLRFWVDGEEHEAAHEKNRMTCNKQMPFIAVFARALAQLPPDHRRAVVRQALAADVPRRPAEGEQPVATDKFAQPTWQPLPAAVRALALDGKTANVAGRSVPDELLRSLGDVLDDSLRERLQSGAPGPGWVRLAQGHWLRSGAPRPRNEPDEDVQVSSNVRTLLPVLAAYWPGLDPDQRARLMPLLSIADTNDSAARDMVELSLDSPADGERAAALRLASRLLPQDSRLSALLRAQVIATSLADRLKPRLNKVFDALRPPGSICLSASGRGSLPEFPWPPPEGYRPPEPLSLGLFGPHRTTAGAWYDRVRSTLRELSSDYETGLFKGPPGGFALVARLERIDTSGKPFPGRARWTTEGQPKLNLTELLADLFLERPGYFRIVVFIVTDQPNFQSDPKARLPDVRNGAAFMPPELGAMRLDGKFVMALVYSFERRPGEPMRAWVEGSPSTLQHLQASGIWHGLQKQP